MHDRLRNFMMGRNGFDRLSIFILVLGLILSVVSWLTGFAPLLVLHYACLLFSFGRAMSRNTYQRQRENMWYLEKRRAIANACSLRKRMLAEWRTHRYLRCPGCRQRLRVPKGRGKIEITCSRCHQHFIKRV